MAPCGLRVLDAGPSLRVFAKPGEPTPITHGLRPDSSTHSDSLGVSPLSSTRC
jgi:hypothetical protein